MRPQEKIGVRSVRLALGVLAGSLFIAGQAMAQEQVQRVEITGSSIKRIAVEGALPVQRVSAETIARTGATNVAELMQSLPAMQGFTIAATAAGSNSGGNVNASIHDIGTGYTLVLLNGRRMAPQGSGSAVNLNAIPLSAIERIEVLTDGASALYGSDAIAGVINFIMKKNQQGGTIEGSFNAPQASGGGKNWDVSASYGFGSLEENGYNVLASFRHDEQTQMKATDREFAKTAYVPFSNKGTNYVYDRTSSATVPANVGITFNGGLSSIAFSPYLKKNGTCPERNFISLNNTATTQNCAFDFASTVEIVPESKRDSLFTKGSLKVGNDVTLFADVAVSRYDLTARIAPNSAPFTILKGSAYYNDNVLPWLTPAQAANVKAISGNYRTYDWGTRDSNTITDSTHLVVGGEADFAGWNINSALTLSKNAINESYVGGYALAKEFKSMLANRSFDPFAPIGKQSAETVALINASQFNGSIRTASTTLKGIDAHGSRELFNLPGGKASIGIGADYREYHYEQTPSAAALDGLIYNFNANPAYDMKRTNQGLFTELVAPVTKELELSGAVRYDSISAIKNAIENRDMGEKQAASTYKLSMRYQPTQTVLLRGSYGTGFKAPDMLDIGQPLVNNGFTASSYNCPITNPDYCRPAAKTQYNQFSGGNESLKPETSKQYTIGFRIEPSQSFSFGADLWDVQMRNQVSAVSEQQAFADPAKFRELFTTYTEPSTGDTYWAFKSLSVNIGKTHNRGIDWDMTGRHKFAFGTLTGNLNGTYLIKSDYTKPGTDNEWTNSLDVYGINNAVSFSNLFKFTGSLETGAFINTLVVSYRNGYSDAETSVRNLTTNKNELIRLDVPSYTTADWQGIYNVNKALAIRAGIRNIFNAAPPLSLRASSGHQVGFDPRYADPTLRSFYMTGSYKF
jgi:iron complex outermembrane receptor protein